jgi:DNA-binding NtrC family response regulator
VGSTIYVVDDEEGPRRVVERALVREGYSVRSFFSAEAALEALRQQDDAVEVVLTDLNMPSVNGLELLAHIRENWPEIPVVLLTGASDVSLAVEAMRGGAYDYLQKPIDPQQTLLPRVRRAVEHHRLVARNRYLERQFKINEGAYDLIGDSKPMREVYSLISSVAPTNATVLIQGESGTGKELIARALHDQSKRKEEPFVEVNCGALAESVLDSELFGHEKGAFTGAVSARKGLFEAASQGTLFLDEVGEMAQATQVRLLRVLQESVVRRLGANDSRPLDVRVVAATNRDLASDVERGTFRLDLYYRLEVVTINVPPLRHRASDIPALAYHLLKRCSERLGRSVQAIDADVMGRLSSYYWPGNVRELENVIERGVILAKGDVLTADLLPAALRRAKPLNATGDDPRLALPLAEAKEAFEFEYLRAALQGANGRPAEAARRAGVDPSNFRRLLKRHRLGKAGSDGR